MQQTITSKGLSWKQDACNPRRIVAPITLYDRPYTIEHLKGADWYYLYQGNQTTEGPWQLCARTLPSMVLMINNRIKKYGKKYFDYLEREVV